MNLIGLKWISGDVSFAFVLLFRMIINSNYIYLTSCVGQETEKGLFGLPVNLPPAHLSTTHGGGFTLSL